MPARKKTPDRDYAVPAVDRMLDVVEFLSAESRPYGISELARRLRISQNMVFRIMKRLQARRYVELDESAGGYRLGTAFFTIGMRLFGRFDLRERAWRPIKRLAETCGETSQIQIPDGDRMLALDSAHPPSPYYMHVVPGSRLFHHANAFGKAVLAFLDDDDRRRCLHGKLPALTPNTLTTPTALRRDLESVRATGLAYDREEYVRGICCIGAPVFDVNGKVVAGLGITGFSNRLDPERQRRSASQVLRCAGEVATSIGYDGARYRKWLHD